MKRKVSPRVYCIAATQAPVVAVFRRGPTQWSHVGRWDLAAQRYEPGAWLAGRLFPRRSDLSPDGRWLSYFAHKPSARWDHGEAYVAISKLPWLTALHAFATCGTWTRGYCFIEDGRAEYPDDARMPISYGLRSMPIVQFALERQRGWVEASDSPRRDPRDMWDERRNARMLKRQPGGHRLLRMESVGWAGGEFGVDQAVDGLRVVYALESDGELEMLHGLQWADWDSQGRLLVATRSGRLEVRTLDADRTEVLLVADLSLLDPAPVPPPPEAAHW